LENSDKISKNKGLDEKVMKSYELSLCLGSSKMKNNGVTKEFYISQSGIKVYFYQVYFWGVH